jgi:hypothetical protein
VDYPPPAFVGDVTRAKIIVLAANGGYDTAVTPNEFAASDSEKQYLLRLKNPSDADWSVVAPYYSGINYAELVISGAAAIVNACAYRSPKISAEPENRKVIQQLPSRFSGGGSSRRCFRMRMQDDDSSSASDMAFGASLIS